MNTAGRILVVDDEEPIRFTVEELLTRDGYQVVTVESGEKALLAIDAQHFDVALLDLKMRGIGGLEILAALHEKAPDTAAIVLTAHGSLQTAVEALRHGAHDYLLKPCHATDLRESVRTALLKRERDQRQKALLLQVERDLTASLEEIRSAVVSHPRAQPPEVAEAATGPDRGALCPGLLVDRPQHRITLDGHLLDLSPTEFEILAYLAEKAPRVVSAQELVKQVQGYACERYEAGEIIRQNVHRIRKAAQAVAGRSDLIRTVRGVGYTLCTGPATKS